MRFLKLNRKTGIAINALAIISMLAATMIPLSAKKPALPETTHDGLVRLNDSKADAVYVAPGADLKGYEKIILLEPTIAFRKGWQRDINANRPMMDRLSASDLETIIKRGKSLFLDEFTDVLEDKGYPVVHTTGEDVLIVRAQIIDLDITAPDPNNTAGLWGQVYAEGSGEATLVIELFDSVSGQILARGVDRKRDMGDSFSWRIPRSQSANIRDARAAFSSWAKMLANGLDRAKKEAK